MSRLFNRIISSFIFRSSLLFSVLPIFKRREMARIREQDRSFRKYGLNRAAGIDLLNDICATEFNCLYSENMGMWSEHLVFFASIAASGRKPQRILEIGTFRGETTIFLSRLFPESEIVTVDLPTKVARDMNLYDYRKTNATFEIRKNNLSKLNNVCLRESSSVALLHSREEFDLIWLDGAHGFPVVTLDIANAFRMISTFGFVICDDVYKRFKRSDAIYDSDATYQTLIELESAGLIQVDYLMKRIGARFQVYLKFNKELAVFRKLTEGSPSEFSWSNL